MLSKDIQGKNFHCTSFQLHHILGTLIPVHPSSSCAFSLMCIKASLRPRALVGLPAREELSRLRVGTVTSSTHATATQTTSPSATNMSVMPCHHTFMGHWSSAHSVVWGKATFTNNVFVLFIEAYPSLGHCSGHEELWWQRKDVQKRGR